MRKAHLVFAICLAATAARTHAADFCVTNESELIVALETASASAEDDTIRLGTSDIHLTAVQIDPLLRGGLRILGGYGSTCALPIPSSPTTTFTASAALTLFRLRLRDADLTLSRLNFVALPHVRITDSDHVSASASGRILIQRVVVRDGGDGLSVYSNHHHVRIENSILARNDEAIGTAVGHGLNLNRGQGALIDVELVNNTIAENKLGIVLVSDGDFDVNAYLYNNVTYGNAQTDLTSEFLLLASHNLWVSEIFGPGAGLAAASENNLHVNPQFDNDYDPIEPGSVLINSGNNAPPGGLPSVDNDGGPRQIGSRVDRGAIESSINDISTFTVTNANNSGAGSLRQAIINANLSSDPSEIHFNISGGCPRVISPTSPLPAIFTPTSILGYSQSGSARNESQYAFDGTLCIALNGAGMLANGLAFLTGSDETMVVEGIAFYGFTSEAVLISGGGRGNVRGNAFGTGAAGLIAPGFDDAAIRVQSAPGSLIGGVDAAERNVISRAAQAGIRLEASSAGREVRGNLIGFNPAGTSAMANGVGIHVDSSSGDSLYSNVIGHSSSHGILVTGSSEPPNDMRISYNYLGYSPAAFGAASIAGNEGNGARFEAGSFINFKHNWVLYNGTDGVVVTSAARRINIASNQFKLNGLQAIDLSPDGVNPIDLDVDATGANDQQNYPSLTSASGTATTGTVTGNLLSANDSYVIRLFRNDACDANNFGEALRYVGEASVTISNAGAASNGSASFSATVNVDGESFLDGLISAIATDSQGNTSEVSACIAYTQGDQIFGNGFE